MLNRLISLVFLLSFLKISIVYSETDFLLPQKKPSIFKKSEKQIQESINKNLPAPKPLLEKKGETKPAVVEQKKEPDKKKEIDNYESYLETTFMEIAPLDYEINNESQKDLSSVPINQIDFPKIVYMIVDSKIELEIKLLKEYPEWKFLSNKDLNRKTVKIYFDLKILQFFLLSPRLFAY